MNKVILEESTPYIKDDLIKNVIMDGYHVSKYLENLKVTNNNQMINSVINNAITAMSYFADPNVTYAKSKILALGKVQSGKTSFFISTIAFSFDNGYDICFVIGGTKYNLLDQNRTRLTSEFKNNEKIKILDINSTSINEINTYKSLGFKLIILVLKNSGGYSANLSKMRLYCEYLTNIPCLIIDDEADEYTPGAPKLKTKNPNAGKTHSIISEIYNQLQVVSILFVTATPQANLLISTLDELSPNYAVLVEPGIGYTGGEAFHDSENNEHVIKISDADDFKFSVPDSYKEALKYFMLASSVMSLNKISNYSSMLIHPSSQTKIQNHISEKISDDFNEIKSILSNNKQIYFQPMKDEFHRIYKKRFNTSLEFSMVFDNLINSIKHYGIFIFNTTKLGEDSIESIYSTSSKHNIYIGGNMLGRGITLKNLIVSYIYRDSKISAVDTLYQRARWFGYKEDYFDYCLVYMTEDLADKFVALADNERDMWNSFREFLQTNIEIRYFPRLFTLSHDKLILTRKSVSKTLTVERIKAGYTYDLSIMFPEKAIDKNRKLINEYIKNNSSSFFEVNFSSTDYQKHLILEQKYSIVYNDLIKYVVFPRNSKLGKLTFEKISEQVSTGILDDSISVIIMRHKTGQYRSVNNNLKELTQLPQGYDPGSKYSGDRNLEGYSNKLHIQIHLVYTSQSDKSQFIPMIALNNPITKYQIRIATGDNVYDKI